MNSSRILTRPVSSTTISSGFVGRVAASPNSSSEISPLISMVDYKYLALVRPVTLPVPDKDAVLILPCSITAAELSDVLHSYFPLPATNLLALDLETRGTDPLNPDNTIVGVGLASATAIVYLDCKDIATETLDALYSWLLLPGRDFVGHNVMFDGAWLASRMSGQQINWRWDTYALYRQLANEGYLTQKYGLKDAQTELLGWDARGDDELNEWLVCAGLHTSTLQEQNPAVLRELYRTGKLRPDKGEMWRAPTEILGYYCGLDVASTYQLLTEVFLPAVEAHPQWSGRFFWYHDLFIQNVFALIEQRLDGISLDMDRFLDYYESLDGTVKQALDSFITHEDIAPLIAEWNEKERAELWAKQPNQFLKGPVLGKEPVKLKKNGEVTASWLKWSEKKERLESGASRVTSKSWLEWNKKYGELEGQLLFNLNSKNDRQWLFYEKLGYPVVLRTETGEPATDKKALKAWGAHGALLKTYNDLVKEQQMSTSCLNILAHHADGTSRIHPEFKAPGTFTCRLAGAGGFNIQQLPKRKEYLSCWVPDAGYAWVDCDHTALEPVVLAALSKDPTMMKLYGPGAPKNDIYLFVGANLPGMGPKIRAAGYDPDSPTPEGIDAAKKACKKERGIAKVIVLGSQYGMGPNKIQLTLALENINITFDEAKAMHTAYWKLYGGVKRYEARLVKEWQANDGWVLNGVGRPVCCAQDMLKDIVNRVVQSTGHDIHMMFVAELLRLREEVSFPIRGIIWDFHDQSIVQVPAGCEEEMLGVYDEAYRRLNAQLPELNQAFTFPLKGDPQIVRNLAEAKIAVE